MSLKFMLSLMVLTMIGCEGADLNTTLQPTTNNGSEELHYLNVLVMCGAGRSIGR